MPSSKQWKRAMADDRDPWERQPQEPDRAWSAFVAFREMKPKDRRVTVIIAEYGETAHTWSSKWHWRQRVQAWDAHLDREAREAEIIALREMREKHIKIAQSMQALGVGEIAKAVRLSHAPDAKDKMTIDVMDAVNIAEKGVRLERLNRGEPETTHEETNRANMTWADLVDAARQQRAGKDKG